MRHHTPDQSPDQSPVRAPAFRRLLAGLAAGATLLAGTLVLGVATAAPAAAEKWPGHPGRTLVDHVVKPGETATGLAVRYHAWTAELVRLNRLGPGGHLVVGQKLRIPVVDAAVTDKPQAGKPKAGKPKAGKPKADKPKSSKPTSTKPRTPKQRAWDRKMRAAGWDHWRHSRRAIKRMIFTEARRQGVPPRLAQAVAWMESGWHQPVVSEAGAIGVMQVLPETGEWMELYAGRELNLRNTHDNILAGVLLLAVLADHTRNERQQVAAYYQGLGAVQEHGLFEESKRYLRGVRAIRQKLHTLP